MLSICIPVYQFLIEDLVTSLKEQAQKISDEIEILVVDDCSDSSFQEQNRLVCEKFNIIYEELPINFGRSKIRNYFLRKATHDFLLFIDCDMKTVNNQFLANYIQTIEKENKQLVVCGGLAYEEKKPSDQYLLRWKYGHFREVRSVSERLKNPNHSFMSSNFLISKSLLTALKFDESLTQYGHEDTLLGIELSNQGIEIQHIDNTLYHLGIETNEIFLEKTVKGIENLHQLSIRFSDNSSFIQNIELLKYYQLIQKYNLTFLVKIGFSLIEKTLYRNLTKGSNNLRFFDMYKLGKIINVK